MKSDATAALEAKEAEAEKHLDAIRKELFDSRSNDAGIHVGDLVTSISRGKPYVYKVSKISFWIGTVQSLEGHKQLKDGGFGLAENYIGTTWKRLLDTQTQEKEQP